MELYQTNSRYKRTRAVFETQATKNMRIFCKNGLSFKISEIVPQKLYGIKSS